MKSKCRSMSHSTFFAFFSITNEKSTKLKKFIFTFLIFVKVRPVWTKITDIHTDTYRHTETDKPLAIDEIVQICLKIMRRHWKNAGSCRTTRSSFSKMENELNGKRENVGYLWYPTDFFKVSSHVLGKMTGWTWQT